MLVLGAVLAGGRSSRFGSDKALASIDGVPMIERVLAQLKSQVAHVVVCGRDYPPYVSVPDRPRANEGPLGGLNAALHLALSLGYDGVVTVGCDMPVLPRDLLKRLTGVEPAVIRQAPIVGYWPVSSASGLERHLVHEPDRSMARWVRTANAKLVELDAELPNINTRDDLAAFIRQ